MSEEIISVNTATVEDYRARLNNLRKAVIDMTSNMRWRAQIKGYDNVKYLLDYQASPSSEYYLGRIDKNISYLDIIISQVNSVEEFLKQIDPLNYADSVAKLESTIWDTINNILEYIDEKILLKFAAKVCEIPGGITSIINNIGNFIETGDVKYLTKIAKSFAGVIGEVLKIDEVSKILVDTFGEVATSAMGTVLDVVGKGFDVITTVIENYEEYGEFSTRMIAECFCEIGIEAAEKALLGVIAGAIGFATGGVGAIIFIAVAEIAIDTTVDFFTDYDSFSELATDAILDYGAKQIEKDAEAISTVCTAIAATDTLLSDDGEGTWISGVAGAVADAEGFISDVAGDIIEGGKEENKNPTVVTLSNSDDNATGGPPVSGGGSGGGGSKTY